MASFGIRGNRAQLTSAPSDVTITVTFSSTPASATSSYADVKYDKQSIFHLEVDDCPVQFMSVLPLFQGGVAPEDSVSYPGYTFTDGCGNNKYWTAGVGINVKSNYNDTLILSGGAKMTTSDLDTVVAANMLPQSHGYYHNMVDGYYTTNNFTQTMNVSECNKYIFTETGFVPRVFIIPNNDQNYTQTAEALAMMATSSQSVTDGYPHSPDDNHIWTDHLGDTVDISSSMRVYGRDFVDDWNDTTLVQARKDMVLGMKNASSSSVHKIYRVGTHGHNSANWTNFKGFISYINSIAADTIWVTTTQEMLEYFEVKRNLIKSESLSGNVLTINLSYNNIPSNNRYRDITLKINSATSISSISVTGTMDSSSYSTSNKLINVFKKKTTGFSTPL